MDDIHNWIAKDFVTRGTFSYVKTGGESSMVYKFEIENAELTDCVMTMRSALDWTYTIPPAHVYPRARTTTTLSMRDVDVSRLAPFTAEPPSAPWREDNPSVSVRVYALPDRGEPFIYRSDKLNERTDQVSFRVRDLGAAAETIDTIRNAARLCANAPEVTQMTNREIVRLAGQHQTDQAITNKIRSAPFKTFEVTPTGLIALKSAGVSDAVIAVMQESASEPQLTSGRARRESEDRARAEQAARAVGTYYRSGSRSDFVILNADGTFEIHEGRKTYPGKYRITGRTVVFTADGPCGRYLCTPSRPTSRLLEPGEATLIDKVVVTAMTLDNVNTQSYWVKE
jgi:hypothetical protein